MDYGIVMSFISWVIVIAMSMGFFLVKLFEKELKNPDMDEQDKISTEAFLMEYWDSNFFGRVHFILLHGARFIAILFFGGRK